MSEKKSVKVVKRAERGKRKPASAKTRRDSARKAARDMVATVSDWVNEFQEKQTRETTKAINTPSAACRGPPCGLTPLDPDATAVHYGTSVHAAVWQESRMSRPLLKFGDGPGSCHATCSVSHASVTAST